MWRRSQPLSLSQDAKMSSLFHARWITLLGVLFICSLGPPAYAEAADDTLSVGRHICVNGTNASIGGEFIEVGADEPPLAVLQCVVPKGYSAKHSYLKIATTIQSSCIFSSMATAVQVGTVWAQPDPTGAFFIECLKSEGFGVHSRHWYLTPDKHLAVKAGDPITVFAKSFSGDSFINLRGMVVEVVKDFAILDFLPKK